MHQKGYKLRQSASKSSDSEDDESSTFSDDDDDDVVYRKNIDAVVSLRDERYKELLTKVSILSLQ